MIYLDHGATSLLKPPQVAAAMARAVKECGNPGRGGHKAAMTAARTVYRCRELAAKLFDCREEQVVFTSSCTHGLNIAIASLVRPGSRVVISGFEHNAVTRPLAALEAKVMVAGNALFDHDTTLAQFEEAMIRGADCAVFTHCSNVFGYQLPVQEMAALCKRYGVPFVIDAAQSAGNQSISMAKLGADFIAMPGHKGLLGPQGTGLLLCGAETKPLLYGGTGTQSRSQRMPEDLPERLEAGTLNVPGIAGLAEGIAFVSKQGVARIGGRETAAARLCAQSLQGLDIKVFAGKNQGGTLSFVPRGDCEEVGQRLAKKGIAVRAGLHCAPLAHESAGTLETGTVRVSFGHDATPRQAEFFVENLKNVM